MKLKSIVTAFLIGQLSIISASYSPIVAAQSADELVKNEVEKGPNNGRMLRDGDFSIELAIFEDGVAPEFRVFASNGTKELAPEDVKVTVKLSRLGGVIDDIGFFNENNYLRGDMEIYEPHSFQVTLTAKYGNETHQWSYDNFEGRTAINDDIADAMLIKTESVNSQVFNETLKVYGKLKIAPNAVRNISARFPGEIKRLHAVLGQRVKKGQLLMTVEGNESLQKYKIYAPINGLVTKQDVGVGEQTNDRTLLTITNTDMLIAELSVFPMDQKKVKLGASVNISIPGTEKVITTQLFDALFDVTKEQAKLFRAEVPNPDGSLRAGQFLSAEILIDEYKVPLAVKADGLQSFRDFTVVYAKVNEEYEVRMLDLGRKVGPWVEVLGGISEGTEYVAKNSYIIKADIDKSGASHDH
ncbi:efflux RND transporter periplasmic adaptor subunit [Cognaticolwellia mytili]|uniref:efflux RND transporter periplasmic adaptor subunit n=1 Tax=Cognaticolwellia mytili TaxID=1888913 RepID=UPI000A16E260|nr:efflux RND transporter periplasmic adaptor subunit [Cognaticolwellia mytili]